ncbi:OmpA family protein [Aurantiacibacter marinus]|uniref:OmpA family protein n=1 Tax=Aurantiacibacter marinus TaxID=874156 RepID=UPI00069BD92D|nr:OmpA family protein [Aurantiacibacter marinus]
MSNRHTIARYAALAIAASALSACELRRDDTSEEEPSPVASAEVPLATPSPSVSESPAVSIIREDVAPVEPAEEPSEPIEITIPFPDGSDIDARAERMLASIMRSDAIAEEWPVILEGHTDSSGNDQANLRASRARAEAVAAWLVERGVKDSRIRVIAFGEQNPAEPNARPDGTPNEQGRRNNRRVEVRIAPASGRAATAPSPNDGVADES